MKPIFVLCLGNDILTDDAFGVEIAKALMKYHPYSDVAEVEFAPVAGFSLLELLCDRKKVLIVDTIQTYNCPPGTLHFFPAGQLVPSNNLVSSHQINLPTALALGAELGLAMPDIIDILAVEAQDVTTVGMIMTPPVEQAIPDALNQIGDWIRTQAIMLQIFGGREPRAHSSTQQHSMPGDAA
ncbi:MAG: hydrogenase maturation protease [candidate division Zixibacteria bacterium]|nr:hydrogenase maturation protease [candidate division Zixibacteria bacterium]